MDALAWLLNSDLARALVDLYSTHHLPPRGTGVRDMPGVT